MLVASNSSQEGYYNIKNPLVEAVPPHIHRPPTGGTRVFTGLAYSGAFGRGRPYFNVVQFIGLQYSVMVARANANVFFYFLSDTLI